MVTNLMPVGFTRWLAFIRWPVLQTLQHFFLCRHVKTVAAPEVVTKRVNDRKPAIDTEKHRIDVFTDTIAEVIDSEHHVSEQPKVPHRPAMFPF